MVNISDEKVPRNKIMDSTEVCMDRAEAERIKHLFQKFKVGIVLRDDLHVLTPHSHLTFTQFLHILGISFLLCTLSHISGVSVREGLKKWGDKLFIQRSSDLDLGDY